MSYYIAGNVFRQFAADGHILRPRFALDGRVSVVAVGLSQNEHDTLLSGLDSEAARSVLLSVYEVVMDSEVGKKLLSTGDDSRTVATIEDSVLSCVKDYVCDEIWKMSEEAAKRSKKYVEAFKTVILQTFGRCKRFILQLARRSTTCSRSSGVMHAHTEQGSDSGGGDDGGGSGDGDGDGQSDSHHDALTSGQGNIVVAFYQPNNCFAESSIASGTMARWSSFLYPFPGRRLRHERAGEHQQSGGPYAAGACAAPPERRQDADAG